MNKIYKVEVTATENHEDGQPHDIVKQVRLISAKTAAKATAFVVKDSVKTELLSVADARTYAELEIEEAGE